MPWFAFDQVPAELEIVDNDVWVQSLLEDPLLTIPETDDLLADLVQDSEMEKWLPVAASAPEAPVFRWGVRLF